MNRIKELRKAKGVSQLEVSNGTLLSPSTIGMYETGERTPNEENRQALADYFGVGVAYLMGYISDEVEAYRKSVEK